MSFLLFRSIISLVHLVIAIKSTCVWPEKVSIPVYWINLNESVQRRHEYENYLKSINIQHHKRIDAINCKNKNSYNFITHVKPLYDNSECDFAVMGSHLSAIQAAVANQRHFSSQYALITEDDIRFIYCVDFNLLIEDAPPDFTVLQLATSREPIISKLWENYVSHREPQLWERRYHNEIWSTQIYLINIPNVRKFLKYSLDFDSMRKNYFSFHIYPAPSLLKYCNTKEDLQDNVYDEFRMIKSPIMRRSDWNHQSCSIVFPHFVETFLYESMYPAYISRLSLVIGSSTSKMSTLHQDHVASVHQIAFERIVQFRDELVGKYRNVSLQRPRCLLGSTD